MKRFLRTFWSGANRPLPAWLTLLLICAGATSWAAAPVYYGYVVMNAGQATPTPAPTGYYGPAVVAQATAAPTAQPGNIHVTGKITADSGQTFVNTSSGGAAASTWHIVQGTVSTGMSSCTQVGTAGLYFCETSTAATLSGAAVFSSTSSFDCWASAGSGNSIGEWGLAQGSFSTSSLRFVGFANVSLGTLTIFYTCAGT